MANIADNIDDVFKFLKSDDKQSMQYEMIRSQAISFAETIVVNTPGCADQTVALRCVREAVMWANSSIALKGLI